MKLLILSSSGFGHGSMYPLQHYRSDLLTRFGIRSQEIVSDDVKEKLRSIKQIGADIILISIPAKLDRHAALDFYIDVQRAKGNAKIVHFDYLDGNQSHHFGVIPHVDLYLKQYVNRDIEDYRASYKGGSKFLTYLIENAGYEDGILNEVWDNLFQSELPPSSYDKLMVGWNFGLWRRLVYLAEGRGSLVLWAKDKPHDRLLSLGKTARDLVKRAAGGDRPIDVYCRATLYSGWTKRHRETAIDLVNELPSKYRLVSSRQKVSFSEYYREMKSSKIFVSPSGWCEYTPKDYEALYFGTILLKPSLEHIDTEPNIMVPNETYVPLKWDLSDLKEKCEYYLSNEPERRRIAENGRRAFVEYFSSRRFVTKFEGVLRKLKLH